MRELLEWMDSGRHFSLTYVTADRKKGTGGDLVSIPRATKTGHRAKDGQKLTPAVIRQAAKNPNHSEHFTRNIVLPNREVRKVHIDLITHFNGKKVL